MKNKMPIPVAVLLVSGALLLSSCTSDSGAAADAGADSGVADAGKPVDDTCGDTGAEDCAGTDAGADTGATPAPDPRFIYDAEGRVLILHGVNASGTAKDDPLRVPTYDAAMVKRVALDWGFNFARYLILWDALEPEKGNYSQAYLDLVKVRLDWFADNGIYVMIDMHQDVYARKFCCDGAPEWAIRDDGQPFEMQGRWFLNYFQPAVERAFDNFWKYEEPNKDLQDHYGGAWVKVAERFKDHPAVIGYDLMNEPSSGSMVDAAELLGEERPDTPSIPFDRERLGPFYQRMIDMIRTVDQRNWIFFEPRYGAPGNGLPSYFRPFSDPREGGPRLAYAPHLYSIKVEGSLKYDPAADPAIPNWEEHRKNEQKRLKTALVIGEWGLVDEIENGLMHLRDVANMADRVMAGWAYWDLSTGGYGFLNDDLTEGPKTVELVRTYPRRIAGVPTSFGYDPETRVFALEFTDSAAVTAPTEIYIPAKRSYPDGWDLTIDGVAAGDAMTWDEVREVAAVTIAPSGKTHAISVTPK